MSKDFEEMSKDELINLLEKQADKHLYEKATLKESFTVKLLNNEDTLFFLSNGVMIAKPYIDGHTASPYVTVSDVIFMESINSPNTRATFNDMVFNLAIDQIIACSQVDRQSFLSQLQPVQES